MADFIPSESHIRNCALFQFHAGCSATRKICDTSGDVLKVNKCQRWFTGILLLTIVTRIEMDKVKFDDDVLNSLVESDPRLSVQELSRSLRFIWHPIVQNHLHEITKVHRQGIMGGEQRFSTNSLHFIAHQISIQETRNGSSVTTWDVPKQWLCSNQFCRIVMV